MRKEDLYKLLYAVGIFLIIGFAVRLGIDYVKYDNVNNSAPFYILVIERTLEFIVPSIIAFIVGRAVKLKYSK